MYNEKLLFYLLRQERCKKNENLEKVSTRNISTLQLRSWYGFSLSHVHQKLSMQLDIPLRNETYLICSPFLVSPATRLDAALWNRSR